MRENASQYHARVVNEFYDALVKGEDARNEAANVLFSAQNLLNHDIAYIPLRKEAKEYLATMMEKPKYYEEAKTITARSTKHEPSRRPQHRAIPLFTVDDWMTAKENGDMKAIDRMVRQATGWRMQTMRNTEEHDVIDQPHHPIRAQGLFPDYDNLPSYESIPITHGLMRKMFARDKAFEFNKAMVKAAKKLHPRLKKNDMLGNWSGNNFTINKMFNIGFEDFKKDYMKKFPEAEQQEEMKQFFIWAKQWENEGIPRDLILRVGFHTVQNSKGENKLMVRNDAGKLFTKLVKDNAAIHLENGSWTYPSMERIGIDAYRDGVYMLPNDMIRDIMHWKINGAESEKELNNIVEGNTEVASYMKLHGRVFNAALRHSYAGGALKRGYSHMAPNRMLQDGELRARLEASPKEFADELFENLKLGRRFSLIRDVKEGVASSLDYEAAVDELIGQDPDIEVEGYGPYPHYIIDGGDEYIAMTHEPPDIKKLKEHGFFATESGEKLFEEFAKKAAQQMTIEGKADLIMESMNDFHYTSDFDEDWINPKDAKEVKTLLGIMSEMMGAHGAQNEEWDDIGQLREDAMPGVWFDTLRGEEGVPERLIMPSFRQDFPNRAEGTQEGPKAGRKKDKRKDAYKKSGNEALDEQNKARMETVAVKNGYTEGQIANLKNKFDRDEEVFIELKDQSNPAAATRAIGAEATADMEDYTKDMPLPRVPASDSLAGFVGAEANLNPDERDELGMLSMDGLHEDHNIVSNHPMSEVQLLRDNAITKNHDRRFFSEQLKGNTLKRFDYDRLKPEHTLRIPIGMMGSHEPLDIGDPVALEDWKSRNHASSRRSDPTGQFRGAEQVHRELTGAVDTEGRQHSSFYTLDEYQKYLDALQRGEFYAPEQLMHGALTKNQLLREVMATEGLDIENSERQMRKLKKRIKEYEEQSNENSLMPFGMTQHGEEYVIAPDISALAYERKTELTNALRFEKDDAKRDIIYAKINELQPYVNPSESNEPIEDHSQLARQTHDVSEEIFNGIVKPAFEFHFGKKAFGYEGMSAEENNDAWAHTVYGMHIAEYIAANLTPEERDEMMRKGITAHGHKSAKSISKLVDNETFRRLNNLQVKRSNYDSKGDFRQLSDFFPEHVKGHEVATHVFSKNNGDRKSEAIFKRVMKEVTQAAEEQGISFEDAFMARYYSHKKLGEAVDVPAPSQVTDRTRRGSRHVKSVLDLIKNPNNLHKEISDAYHIRYDEGGVHKLNSETHNLLHGGDSVKYHGKAVSMDDEFNAIQDVMGHTIKHLEGGSDRNILATGIRLPAGKMQENIFPRGSKEDLTRRYKRMREMAHSLGDDTVVTNPNHTLSEKTLRFGGGGLDKAPLIPLYTSKEYMNKHGRSVPLKATINKDALKQGHIVFQSPEIAPNCLPNGMRKNMFVSRDAMMAVNPMLQPHTFGLENSFGQQTPFDARAQSANDLTELKLASADVVIDDSLITKEDGKPQPVKFMHRIFDLEDMQHLRGFTGDWVISLYPQGEHVIATKDKKGITAYGVDGEVKLDEAILEEADKVYEKDFTVHAILHDGLMTVVDLLKTADEDTHNMPTKDRIRHLRAQYESSEHIKMPEPINTKRSDDEGLQTAIEGLRGEQNIDILLRDANATYMKGEPRHPKWVLLSKEKMVDVVILSRAGKNYTVGVGPLMHPENYGKRAQEHEGEHYMMVGNAKGPRGLNVGDFATVRCTGVSASKGEYPVYRIRSAKITDNEPLAADSVETLAILAGEQHVAQRVGIKKGQIVINFPAFDDDVICKTRKEEGVWFVEPQTTTWGNEYLVRLAEDQQVYWEYQAALLLKKAEVEEPEYDEVKPEPPAGHSKKPKKVLEEEEEVIKRGLELAERGLEHLAKEKITSTGVQGLGIGYATPDEHPRGPTQNINDETLPDFDPAARKDDELKPATEKKTKRLRSTEGEEAVLEDDGVVALQ